MSGPLAGLRVVELAGIGPGPHACMLLADMGADVIRIERSDDGDRSDIALRGRTIVCADLKDPSAQSRVLELVSAADVLVEGFRPGVAERMGLGPDVALARNPRLIYGRMTGWGQSGPRALRAGHDINYISVTGILDNIGRAGGKPTPPLNLVGDFGGGSMFLVVGVLAALHERATSGRGQVVDAAMVDGASALAQMQWSFRSRGSWGPGRGVNLLDGSLPFYDTYECADGSFVAVGAMEAQFYDLLLAGLGIDADSITGQWDRTGWDDLRRRFAEAFAAYDRAHWMKVFEASDACVTPVLTWDEALRDEHLVSRGTLRTVGGVDQAAPAPRFSRSTLDGFPAGPVRATALETALARWESASLA